MVWELNKIFNYDKEHNDNKKDMINQTWISKLFEEFIFRWTFVHLCHDYCKLQQFSCYTVILSIVDK